MDTIDSFVELNSLGEISATHQPTCADCPPVPIGNLVAGKLEPHLEHHCKRQGRRRRKHNSEEEDDTKDVGDASNIIIERAKRGHPELGKPREENSRCCQRVLVSGALVYRHLLGMPADTMKPTICISCIVDNVEPTSKPTKSPTRAPTSAPSRAPRPHLFKRVKNTSLYRMFGKPLSAKDEKVI